MQVVHYESTKRALYEAHIDSFDKRQFPNHPQYQQGCNRLATIFFYLSAVEEGGETAFVRAAGVPNSYLDAPITDYSDCTRGYKVKPMKATAVLWYNVKQLEHMVSLILQKKRNEKQRAPIFFLKKIFTFF
jgi:hypothetical protein